MIPCDRSSFACDPPEAVAVAVSLPGGRVRKVCYVHLAKLLNAGGWRVVRWFDEVAS